MVDFLLACPSQALCTTATLYMLSVIRFFFIIVIVIFCFFFGWFKVETHLKPFSSFVSMEVISDQYFIHYPTQDAHLSLMGRLEKFELCYLLSLDLK